MNHILNDDNCQCEDCIPEHKTNCDCDECLYYKQANSEFATYESSKESNELLKVIQEALNQLKGKSEL